MPLIFEAKYLEQGFITFFFVCVCDMGPFDSLMKPTGLFS